MQEGGVRLRAVTEADLPDYVRWLNDPEVTRFISAEPGTVTIEGEREWLARINAPDRRGRTWAIEAGGPHIGNCALQWDEAIQVAGFGIAIGDKTAWNKGFGTATLRQVLRIGFEDMALHRVHLGAFARNGRAIRCYEKCGFRHEGLQRRAVLKRGEWHDHVIMAILREEWEEIHRPSAHEGIRIRAFTLGDHEQVAHLWQVAGLGSRPSDALGEVAKKLRRDPDLFLVACEGERIVGSVIGGWDGRRGFPYRMAVHPDYQRRGIGRALMTEVEAGLRARGALSINVILNADNARARSFYRSLGYADREGVRVMAKTLSA